MDVVKGDLKVLTPLTIEIECDEMAMGLLTVISAVFLLAKSHWESWGNLRCLCYSFEDKA
jgi:hypothetical protein